MRQILLIFLSIVAFYRMQGQTITVSGIISDGSTAELLPGVSVQVKNTQYGSTSDIDGKYILTNIKPTDTIIFSFVGYKSLAVSVNNRSIIDIQLDVDIILMDDVIIIGYGSQKKSDLTGSVSSVRGKDITKIPLQSAELALQGKVAGLQVSSSSGAPGSVPLTRIRGIGTLNNAAPIFVVDGVILNDISFLNSSDIQSIEVLKDASATAIYGSRGANGVIIITTTAGNSSPGGVRSTSSIFSLSSEFGIQLLQKQINLLNGREFAEVVNVINPGTYNNLDKVPDTDWQDLIFDTYSPLHNYHASLSGSGEKNDYYFGMGYFFQDGIIPKSDYERISLKLNNTYYINKYFDIGINIAAAPDSKNNEAGVVAQAYRAWPTSEPFNSDGSFAEVLGSGNPLASIEYNNSYTNRLRSVGNFFTDIHFLKSFTFRSSWGYDFSYVKEKSFTPAYFVSASQSNALSDLKISEIQFYDWLWENTVVYDQKFGKHNVNILGGITAQKNTVETLTGNIQDLLDDDPALWYLDAGDINYLNTDNFGEITTLASYLFRTNYSYNNKYLLTASYRLDGSSKFGLNDRWGSFPSIALGWNLGYEDFIQQISQISTLKLRASWGIIGNEKIPWYRQYSLVKPGQNAVFGTAETLIPGATYGVSGNADLQWENTIQFDVGIEIGLISDKLKAEIDFYNKITEGILVDLLTPGHLGNGPYQTTTYNAAKVLNRGFEYTVSWTEKRGNFDYRIGLIGSTIHNEVLELGAFDSLSSFIPSGSLGNGQLVTRTVVGQPVGAFYGYEVIGVIQNDTELASSAIIDGEQTGDLKFEDQNNDGIIDENDRVFLGSYIPDFVYGINTEFNYKQFGISLDFSGQLGNEIYNGKAAVRPDLYNFETNIVDHWSGDGTSDTEPRPTSGGVNYEPSSYFIQDGSFFRLRSVAINYNLPENLVQRIKMRTANVYLRGTNVFTFSDYSGYTPEIASADALSSGIDLGVYPITTIYSAGLNITF